MCTRREGRAARARCTTRAFEREREEAACRVVESLLSESCVERVCTVCVCVRDLCSLVLRVLGDQFDNAKRHNLYSTFH